MNKKEKIDIILKYVDSLFPNAKCELFYNKDYELAIAVLLSAQTTDQAVNKVTKVLFDRYSSLEALDKASEEDIENIIKSIGLYKNKAKAIKGLVNTLLTKYDGVLPSDKKELVTLPGIGNKSAGVIRCEVFKIPDLPVDTHIIRVTNRLGLAEAKDEPIDIERKLKKIIDESRWIKTHHQLIHFGRYFCTARNPKCEQCKIKNFCKNSQGIPLFYINNLLV